MTNKDILKIAMTQSAIDMNCSVKDFTRQGSKVVISSLKEGAKKCYTQKIFCGFVFYGDGLVATVDAAIKPYIEAFMTRHSGFRCFDTPQLIVLNKEFEKYGKSVCHIAEFFLPDMEKQVRINEDITIKIMEGDEISDLYADDRFHMALSYDNVSNKRDVLAVCGYINGELVGIAGASNDSETMWQIGIDVVSSHRKKGVAVTLIKNITDEIIRIGKVPYYCTAWSNIASKRSAINSGYKTAWVEMTAKDTLETMKMIGEEQNYE
ncbi:GNAT family N-acetyltransferase [Fusibacter bizertensis]|uniref:GNAT family N-acetyltransferase n=1 Tax=Fusibacter bizertensis TaxID=1488331 RepID=A0ABT6N8X7_9FIRM|nr:GNAT family N-acetyltransferase [Fusibacter bizertensis]MDH8676870.1 GNAT family N-acetyltransferase [Fusibacter bizertensis]